MQQQLARHQQNFSAPPSQVYQCQQHITLQQPADSAATTINIAPTAARASNNITSH